MATPDPFGLSSDILSAELSAPAETRQLVQRVENALVDAATGGESWREIPLQGELVRARQYRPPDVAAAKALLAAKGGPEWQPQPTQVNVAVSLAADLAAARARAGIIDGQCTDVTPVPVPRKLSAV